MRCLGHLNTLRSTLVTMPHVGTKQPSIFHCQTEHLGAEPKIGGFHPPKMDGENFMENRKTLLKWDDLGKKDPPLFLVQHPCTPPKIQHSYQKLMLWKKFPPKCRDRMSWMRPYCRCDALENAPPFKHCYFEYLCKILGG